MRNQVLAGDCLAILRTLPAESIHCCVTSPPYWNLRDYQAEGQLGLEQSPEEYVGNIVAVFREVRRVLHPTGTLWLNLGDSYARKPTGKIKGKDLVGIPWAVAFALRDDGWWLRADNIWAKGNPMPEPVTDRTTRAHEFVFQLAKRDQYYYDHRAILEPFKCPDGRDGSRRDRQRNRGGRTDGYTKPNGIDPSANGGANKRSVWAINTTKFKQAHFATFPPALPELCIRAATSPRGCCATCHAPYVPTYERVAAKMADSATVDHHPSRAVDDAEERGMFEITGWTKDCEHRGEPIPCVVLDPFAGSGTTLAVAKDLGRDFVGIEINPEYVGIAEQRIEAATDRASERQGYSMAGDLPQE